MRFLISLREDYDPDYLAVVFDSGMSDREKLYPAYKATREKMPDDLRSSLPRVRALVDAFHDRVIEVEGFEADDVIGTLAAKAGAQGLDTVIVSGDSDGGLPSAGSPFAASPAGDRDGFVAVFSRAGDACQCGDVDLDGEVTIRDMALIKRHDAGLPLPTAGTPFFDVSQCSVSGSAMDCDGEDVAAVRDYLTGVLTSIENLCAQN